MPLIVGLGNPGARYERTPHNMGFAAVELLVKRRNLHFRGGPVTDAESARMPNSDLIFLRPLSFMNRSGYPVSAALNWFGLTAKELFVICDDVNLPFGELRFREKGGAGGQKGLISVIAALGNENFLRLRIGVGGGEPGSDVGRHVLAKYTGELRQQADNLVERAADAVDTWLSSGLDIAMNRFHGKPGEDS